MYTSPCRGDALARQLAFSAMRQPLSVLQLRPSELDLTLRVLRRMRLLGRLAWNLAEQDQLRVLPPVARDPLQSALVMSAARSRLLRRELQQLSRCLAGDAQAPVIVLKGGAYLLLGLPNAQGRLPTDVDLLVPEHSLRGCEQRLFEGGWRSVQLTPYDERYYREWTHEIPPLRHPEREMEVDVHHNILQRTARLRPDPALLIAAARPVGDGLHVLAPVDMVLHAITHLFASSEPIDALRELVDVQLLMEHFAQAEPGFWEDFPERAMQLDLARPAFHAVRYCQSLLGFRVPRTVHEKLSAAAPPRLARAAMDWCLPRALVAQHPDEPGVSGSLSRALLLARAHWIRMPPLLLARHLLRKTMVRLRSRGEDA